MNSCMRASCPCYSSGWCNSSAHSGLYSMWFFTCFATFYTESTCILLKAITWGNVGPCWLLSFFRVVTRYIFSSLIPNFSSKFWFLIPKMWQHLIPDSILIPSDWPIRIPWLVTRDPGSMIPIPRLWSLIPYTWLRPCHSVNHILFWE